MEVKMHTSATASASASSSDETATAAEKGLNMHAYTIGSIVSASIVAAVLFFRKRKK